MKVYELHKEQFILYPIEKYFFDRPENLEVLTPSNLKFKILTRHPSKCIQDPSLIMSSELV